MILAAHQPNYLPWAGFFHKMARCDILVLLDSVQYARRSYTARCLIKQSDGRRHWLSVPVRKTGRYYQRISQVEIWNEIPWQQDHLRTLSSNYARAPYFKEYRELLDLAYGRSWSHLSQMNISLIEYLAEILDLHPKIIKLSHLDIEARGTDLLIEICRRLGAEKYLSGPSGQRYLAADKFRAAGIELEIFRYWPRAYPQLWGGFVPGLSLIDILFNCGAEAAKRYVVCQEPEA
jgi:hypothetical protein